MAIMNNVYLENERKFITLQLVFVRFEGVMKYISTLLCGKKRNLSRVTQ
jgi:hypothetical protein